jgi:DNA polymerase-4
VQLKVRYGDFRTITRSRTLPEPTDVALEIARSAVLLLGGVEIGAGVRLLGVSAQQLEDAGAVQASLPFDDAARSTTEMEQRRLLERSVDAVRDRFGDGAVVPARFVQPGVPPPPPPATSPR